MTVIGSTSFSLAQTIDPSPQPNKPQYSESLSFHCSSGPSSCKSREKNQFVVAIEVQNTDVQLVQVQNQTALREVMTYMSMDVCIDPIILDLSIDQLIVSIKDKNQQYKLKLPETSNGLLEFAFYDLDQHSFDNSILKYEGEERVPWTYFLKQQIFTPKKVGSTTLIYTCPDLLTQQITGQCITIHLPIIVHDKNASTSFLNNTESSEHRDFF